MFAAMVWGKKTKQPGFVEKLTLWMRQVFPFSMWYPNKYVLISQEAVLALSSSASVIQAARSWQILKLGKASKIIPRSWFGCLFGIWWGFNKLSCKKWKPQAVVGRWWRGREAGGEGSWCARAAVELGICSLPTPESSTAGLQWHQAWAETQFLCMTPELQTCWRHTAFFQRRMSLCLPAAYTVGPKKWMCKYFVSHSSPRSSFWNSKQAQNPKKISLSYE